MPVGVIKNGDCYQQTFLKEKNKMILAGGEKIWYVRRRMSKEKKLVGKLFKF